MEANSMKEELAEALGILVELKDYKDEHGKDAYYKLHQPDAWRYAKQVMQRYSMHVLQRYEEEKRNEQST